MLRRIVHFKQAEEYLAARQDRPTYLKASEYLTAWDAETRRKAFFSARVASADILSELHQRCQQVVNGDMTDRQARELLRVFLNGDGAAALRQLGFMPQGEAAQSVVELASVRRLQLILYQNAKIAQEAGHYRQWAENAALFPYGRWHLGHAEEHRPEHAARDGKVYAFEHPIWRTSPPGSEFNCHCWREELTAEEAAGLTVQPNDQTVPRPTVDFDPGAPLDVPPPVKARTPPGILQALRRSLGSQPRFPTEDLTIGEDRSLEGFDAQGRAAMAAVEKGFAGAATERGMVFARDGKQESGVIEGDAGSIAMGAKRDLRERVVTHWHPDGGTFSPDDVYVFAHFQIAELRAVTSEGIYSITPESGAKFATTKLGNLKRALTRIGPQMLAAAKDGDYRKAHGLMAEVCMQNGVSYTLRRNP
jgi:hypothetical protein